MTRKGKGLAVDISFVLPAYYAHPVGGYKIVYEHANLLASKGHRVAILFHRPPCREGLAGWIRPHLWAFKFRIRYGPLVPWFSFRPNVRLLLVPDLQSTSIPHGDVIFATAWQTAGPVAALPFSKGHKCYLIQSYEIWSGSREQVEATWCMPLRKAVVSKWLQGLSDKIGAGPMAYVPNAIDMTHFRVQTAPATRPPHIVAMYHPAPVKGSSDALTALTAFHEKHPEIPVTMFGTAARGANIPAWIAYHHNPSQDALVEIYNRGTVYVAASLVEGWSLPPAEAMACGCVFVGTDSGGVGDYAVHDDTALLSPPGRPGDLLANLLRVMEDPVLTERLRVRGTARVAEFTWEASGKAMDAFIRTAVSDG